MSIARRFSDSGVEDAPLPRRDGRWIFLSGLSPWRWPKAASLYLAIAISVTIGPLTAVAWYGTPLDKRDSAIAHTWLMVSGQGGGDSWGPMTIALSYVDSGGTRPLYSEMFQVRKIKYQYPPSALFALMGLRLAGPETITISHVPARVWPSTTDMVGWAFYAAMIAAVISIFELQIADAPEAGSDPRWLRMILVGVAALTFYLALKAFTLGQIQVWINSAFAIALLLWMRGKRALGGIAIGLICLIKPHYGLFLAWAALRREWAFLIAAATIFGIGTVAAISVFGWSNHLDYLAALSTIAAHGEAYFPNQSINGLLNRWMGLARPDAFNNQVFLFDHFPPFDNVVFWGTRLTSVLLLGAALLVQGPDRDAGRRWDFCRMALTLTIASPIAWEHHYGILLPIFALLLAAGLHRTPRLLWLGLAYGLTFNLAPLTNQIHDTIFNPVQSYVLLAGFIVLTMLYLGPPARNLPSPARAGP